MSGEGKFKCYINAVALVHLNGRTTGRWWSHAKETCHVGISGEADYRNFDQSHGVSRKHCMLVTEDDFTSVWVKDERSRKGTYVCIGGSGREVRESQPVYCYCR